MEFKSKRTWLFELRTSKNLTQGKMAQVMGISRSYYNKIENGVRGLRGQLLSDHFVSLSCYFGLSLEAIHEMEGNYLSESLNTGVM